MAITSGVKSALGLIVAVPKDKLASERPRTKADATDLDLFLEHEAGLIQFTQVLQERRCRRTRRFDEQIKTTMEVFRPLFSPWNMEVLFLLYMHGAHRFNQIKQTAGISSRVLTDKLRHLQEADLVTRSAFGPRVDYDLTYRGLIVARHLHPLLFALQNEQAMPASAGRG